jgi:hypothetical protein
VALEGMGVSESLKEVTRLAARHVLGGATTSAGRS